jgi:hypothetical protein
MSGNFTIIASIVTCSISIVGCVQPAIDTEPEAAAEAAAAALQAKPEAAQDLAKPGFAVFNAEERIWVFQAGSKDLAEFEASGPSDKHVTLIGAGPDGRTIKAPDRDTALAYLAARSGFVVIPSDGRLWLFKEGSPELAEFQKAGEPEKHVTRVGAGPLGTTVKAPDAQIIDAWLASR